MTVAWWGMARASTPIVKWAVWIHDPYGWNEADRTPPKLLGEFEAYDHIPSAVCDVGMIIRYNKSKLDPDARVDIRGPNGDSIQAREFFPTVADYYK